MSTTCTNASRLGITLSLRRLRADLRLSGASRQQPPLRLLPVRRNPMALLAVAPTRKSYRRRTKKVTTRIVYRTGAFRCHRRRQAKLAAGRSTATTPRPPSTCLRRPRYRRDRGPARGRRRPRPQRRQALEPPRPTRPVVTSGVRLRSHRCRSARNRARVAT